MQTTCTVWKYDSISRTMFLLDLPVLHGASTCIGSERARAFLLSEGDQSRAMINRLTLCRAALSCLGPWKLACRPEARCQHDRQLCLLVALSTILTCHQTLSCGNLLWCLARLCTAWGDRPTQLCIRTACVFWASADVRARTSLTAELRAATNLHDVSNK